MIRKFCYQERLKMEYAMLSQHAFWRLISDTS